MSGGAAGSIPSEHHPPPPPPPPCPPPPATRGSDLTAAARHFLAVTLPHLPMSLLISRVLNNHKGGKHGGDMTWQRQHFLFRKRRQANGSFHLWSLRPAGGHLLTRFPNGRAEFRWAVLSRFLSGTCLSLCSARGCTEPSLTAGHECVAQKFYLICPATEAEIISDIHPKLFFLFQVKNKMEKTMFQNSVVNVQTQLRSC